MKINLKNILYLAVFITIPRLFGTPTFENKIQSISATNGKKMQSDLELERKFANETPSLLEKDLIMMAKKAPSAPTDTTSEEVSDDEKLDMNFENISLGSWIKILAEKKNLNIMINKDLFNTKVSLRNFNPVNLDQAWEQAMTVINVHGFTHVKVGDLDKILPLKDAGSEPFPIYSSAKGIEPDELPDSDEIIRYVYFLKNIKTETAINILSALLSERPQTIGDIEVLIMKDRARVIKQAMKIIETIDTGGAQQSVMILPLQYTDPEMVSKFLNEDLLDNKQQEGKFIIRGIGRKSAKYFSTDVRIIPYKTNRSLILMGQKQEIQRFAEFIKLAIDRSVGQAKSRIHIKEIHNHNPGDLQKLLQKIIKSQGSGSASSPQPYFNDVVIAAESPKSGKGQTYASGSRLIVSCNPEDWQRLEDIIEKLDKPLPQVALEIMIVEVTTDLAREIEGQIRDTGFGILGKNLSWRLNHIAEKITNSGSTPLSARETLPIKLPEAPTGSTMLTFGSTRSDDDISQAWGALKFFIKQNNSNIISQPFLVANNNETCNIESSDSRQVPGEFMYSNNRSSRKQEYITARTLVEVTPRINSDAVVDMQIKITVENFQTSDTEAPTKNTSNIDTRTSMGLGEVLVLGGLSSSRESQSDAYTPILGHIPILGQFFSGKARGRVKKNLYVFIRPSIIKPVFGGEPDAYTSLKLKYAKLQIDNVNTYVQTKDPIERFFFKPRNHSVKQTLEAYKDGKFSWIDDFAERKDSPVSADVENDPYFGLGYRSNKHAKNKQTTMSADSLTAADPALSLGLETRRTT